MVQINKLHLIAGLIFAILVFMGLYFALPYLTIPKEQGPATIGKVEIPKEANIPDLSIIGAYWGSSDFPMNYTETCSNQTKDVKGTRFSIEAESRIVAPNYDECYIVNNGDKLETTVIEMHGNYMNLQAFAETDRKNEVGVCCLLGDRLDCSNTTTLLMCPLE